MAETCKACGKAWMDHLGVEPTCALLQEAVALLVDAKGTEPECGQPCETCGDYFSSRGEHASDCWHDQVKKLIDRLAYSLPQAKIERTPRANSVVKRRRSEA